MKKLLIGAAAATLLASTAGADANVFKGPYVGAQVGYSHNSTSMKILEGTSQPGQQNNHGGSSATFMAVAGYSDLWDDNHLYGMEIRGGYNTLSNKKGGDKLTMDWTVGLRGRYGFILDQAWLPFVSLGVDYSHARYNYSYGTQTGVKDNFRVWEISPGFGVEWSLSEKVNFRADYEFAFNINDRGLNTGKAKVHNGPNRHHARVGVMVNF